MKKNIKKNVLLIVLALIFLFSVFKISVYFIELGKSNHTNKKLVKQVVKVEEITTDDKDNVVEKFTIDYDSLLKINEDVRGWIRFNQDKINYPIVQSTDNSYYLNRDINKKSSSLGSIFMDYRNNSFQDKNVVIFGHNVIPDGSMFGSLKDVLKNKFFDKEENRIIEIIGLNNNIYRYEIFSVYTIPVEEYYITTSFNSNEEYIDFLNTVKSRSVREFNSVLSQSDNILTLSTCDGYASTNKRLVVHAKLKKS